MQSLRSGPNHPQTLGKIGRWHENIAFFSKSSDDGQGRQSAPPKTASANICRLGFVNQEQNRDRHQVQFDALQPRSTRIMRGAKPARIAGASIEQFREGLYVVAARALGLTPCLNW
jgi:hypothetical protein